MSPLTREQIEHFKHMIAGIDMSDSRKDELIRILDNIVVSFIDQAFGLDPTQLSLSTRANFSFLGVGEYAKEKAVIKQQVPKLLLDDSGNDPNPEST